jgi:hypothetical protein
MNIPLNIIQKEILVQLESIKKKNKKKKKKKTKKKKKKKEIKTQEDK